MYNFLLVNIDEPLDKMIEVILNFYLWYSFSTFHHFVESVITAQLQNDVNVLTVLEDVVEKQNVFVLQRTMDLYLGH